LPGSALDCDPPTSTSQVTGIIGRYHHAQLPISILTDYLIIEGSRKSFQSGSETYILGTLEVWVRQNCYDKQDRGERRSKNLEAKPLLVSHSEAPGGPLLSSLPVFGVFPCNYRQIKLFCPSYSLLEFYLLQMHASMMFLLLASAGVLF
jgi:hypothetical protein